jgi:hypothetical protein
MDLKTSRAVCLPKSWLEYYERESGCKITEVAMEVDKVLTVTPILTGKSPAMHKSGEDSEINKEGGEG